MRVAATILTYVVALPVVTAAAFIVVLFLAGPHAGLLPQWAEVVVLAGGWIAVAVAPAWAALRVWRRLGRTR